jgi:hypothetical protein
VLGEVPLASAALFDLGVYITVVGATLLTLSVLGHASKEGHVGPCEESMTVSLEFLVASGIGWVTACGIYLMLRGRTFPVVLGLSCSVMRSTCSSSPWVACGGTPRPSSAAAHGRPPAAGPGAHGHRDRLCHHRLRRGDGLRSRHESGTDHVDGPGGRGGARMNGLYAFWTQHLPILPVLLPAFTAMALLLLGDAPSGHAQARSQWGRRISLLSLALGLWIAVSLVQQASEGTLQVYRLGDWPAPFGIVLVIDRLSALMLVLTSNWWPCPCCGTPAAAGTPTAATSTPCSTFQVMGLCGAFVTGDLFNLFVFFEVLADRLYVLMVHGQGKSASRPACTTWCSTCWRRPCS